MVSKSQADKAGRVLAKAENPLAPELAHEGGIVDEWRAVHGAPLLWVAESVQNRARGVVGRVAVGQRLKRKPQIIGKLKREHTRLAQMQDVGGCRAIVELPSEIDAVADRLRSDSKGRHYQFIDQDDYRADGRAGTGYRALHLIVVRDSRQIEIQLRTFRQQSWAEGVERAGNRAGFNLKAGKGPDEIIEYFRLASAGFAALDEGKHVKSSARKKLRELRSHLDERLEDMPRSRKGPRARIRPQSFRTRLNNWLIVYDWEAAQPIWWSDLGADTAKAVSTYAAYEADYPYEDGYEVVLIGADSTATIEKTHAHYFGKSPNDFDPLGYFRELEER